jgi:hypothetical protein
MTTLAEIKRTVEAGQVYDVTNHYITRTDHPAYGTTRRKVTRALSSRFYLEYADRPGNQSPVDWPRASQVQRADDGTLHLYGGGIGQKPDELFLTLVPVRKGGLT